MAELKQNMSLALPMLHRVGFFDLFTPDEWIKGQNQGRKVVGQLYLDFLASLPESSAGGQS